MTTYRNKKLRENKMEDAPIFYRTASGNPYVGRLAGIDTRNNLFETVRVDDIKDITIAGIGGYEHFHGLGYKPFVVGSYVMKNIEETGTDYYPDTLRGFIPEDRSTGFLGQTLLISYIDKSKLNIRVVTDATQATFDFKLILLREKTIGD